MHQCWEFRSFISTTSRIIHWWWLWFNELQLHSLLSHRLDEEIAQVLFCLLLPYKLYSLRKAEFTTLTQTLLISWQLEHWEQRLLNTKLKQTKKKKITTQTNEPNSTGHPISPAAELAVSTSGALISGAQRFELASGAQSLAHSIRPAIEPWPLASLTLQLEVFWASCNSTLIQDLDLLTMIKFFSLPKFTFSLRQFRV